ncbi:MAG: heme exporter protein CcmD [Rhizobiaceae bacterium]
MSHAFFVTAAYGVSFLALAGLVIWIIADHRGRRRELAELEESGVRRRSDRAAEPAA